MSTFNIAENITSPKVMTLKKQLKLYLDKHELTAAQLSRKSGISQQVISLWLRGAEPKKLTQVRRVAEIFSTTVDHLCFGEGLQSQNSKNESLLPDSTEWTSGIFEIKIRRIKI